MVRWNRTSKPASQAPSGPLEVPNKRFWSNRCLQCVKLPDDQPCTHAPFGAVFYWHWHAMRAFEGAFGPRPRFYVTEWARRHRKSSFWLNMQIRECYRIPKTRRPIIGPTFAECRRIYFQDPRLLWDSLPGQRGVDWEVNESELLIFFPRTRSIIPFYGGDDPGNLSGIEGESFVFDEWSMQKLECWTEIVSPIVAQDPSKWVAFSYCVSPNTKVLTSSGWTSIGKIGIETSLGYTPCDEAVFGLGGFHAAEQFYRTGIVPTVRLRTRKGYEIECTPQHQLWTPDGWVRSDKLTCGSRVCIQHSQAVWGSSIGWNGYEPAYRGKGSRKRIPFSPNTDFYYFLGQYMGNGSLGGSGNVVITTTERQTQEWLASYGFVLRYRYHNVLCCSAVVRLLRWMGMEGHAHEKQLPGLLWKAPKWAQAAFLSGWFDSDGSISKKGEITLTSTSEQAIKDTQVMLLNFGIICHRSSIGPGVSKLAHGKHRGHILTMGSRWAERFHEAIGFQVERKRNRRHTGRINGEPIDIDCSKVPPDYFDGMKCKYNAVRGRLTYATVEKVHKLKPHDYWRDLLQSDMFTDSIAEITCGASEVMDFVIPDTHSFVSNGFISHNTPKGGHGFATQMFDHAACVDEGLALPTDGPAERMRPDWYASRVVGVEKMPNGRIRAVSGVFGQEELEKRLASPEQTPELFWQEYGCARITEEQFALITSAALDNLMSNRPRSKMDRAIISCDPALGGDAVAVDVAWGRETILHKSFRTTDLMRIVGELRMVSDQTGIYDFIIDSIGLGAGVAHRLREDTRYNVQAFESGESADDPKRFRNRKAEMWWLCREEVMNNEVARPDEETCRQIPYASRYKPPGSDGRMQMLLKQDVKKLLGRSPDDADAWAMGRYGLRHARQCLGKAARHVIELVSDTKRRVLPYDPMTFIDAEVVQSARSKYEPGVFA